MHQAERAVVVAGVRMRGWEFELAGRTEGRVVRVRLRNIPGSARKAIPGRHINGAKSNVKRRTCVRFGGVAGGCR